MIIVIGCGIVVDYLLLMLWWWLRDLVIIVDFDKNVVNFEVRDEFIE